MLGLVFAETNELNVEITEVEVNGVELNEDAPTRLSILRGEDLDLRIRLLALNSSDNVQIRAFIDGYEYSDYQDISDYTPVFEVEAGVEYIKKLTLRLPEDVDKDSYKIKIFVSDRYGKVNDYYYNILVDVPRHDLKISDVALSPLNNVKAGTPLRAVVKVDNMGAKSQRNVKVIVSIPELGISESDYISEIETDDSEISEYMYLMIPICAKEGSYDLVVKTIYNNGYSEEEIKQNINVLPSELCKEVTEKEDGKIIMNVLPSTTQNIKEGERAVFSLSLVNTGENAKTIILKTTNNDWANVEMSENLLLIEGESSKNVFLYVTPKEKISGTNALSLQIISDNKVLGELPMTVKVEKTEVQIEDDNKPIRDLSNLRVGLEIAIIILVIVLVVIVITLSVTKKKKNDDKGEDEKEEGYY